jgi:hypothetical protein
MPKEENQSVVEKATNFIQKAVDDTVEDTKDLADRAQKAMGNDNENKKNP